MSVSQTIIRVSLLIVATLFICAGVALKSDELSGSVQI